MTPTKPRREEDTENAVLLAVDDDEQILKQIKWAFSDDYRVLLAGSCDEALAVLAQQQVDMILLDLGLPPHPREAVEGFRALEAILSRDPLAKVIVVSGNSERENARRAIEKGAFDMFPKPIDVDALKIVLSRVLHRLQLERESLVQPPAPVLTGESEAPSAAGLIGESDAMRQVYNTIRKVASTDVPVLITGESGTGKELVARAVHEASPRKGGPLAAVNCAAIPENLIESELFGYEKGAFTGADERKLGRLDAAKGGSLFLDEIGELELGLQVKLLRFLQEKCFERVGGNNTIELDARVIAATNRDLGDAVESKSFRADLYYRLAVVKVALPALRDRGADVKLLAEHFCAHFCQETGSDRKRFSSAALTAMQSYTWPGNVRELQNRVQRAVVLATGAVIGVAELELATGKDGSMPRKASLKAAKEELEREMVAKALADNNGNISKTARHLGISRPTLYDLIARYKL